MGKGLQQTPRILNKRARHDYEIIEHVEAGIALTGSEVKSLRAGRASLEESYAHVRDSELYLIGCNISPYENAGYAQHTPVRDRKLLLHRRQLRKWEAKVTQRGFTMVPLALYFNERGLVKVDIALARGKSHSDKRESLKRREAERDMQQALRRRR